MTNTVVVNSTTKKPRIDTVSTFKGGSLVLYNHLNSDLTDEIFVVSEYRGTAIGALSLTDGGYLPTNVVVTEVLDPVTITPKKEV